MRTVSQDDELIVRGANPRTGAISPYVQVALSDDETDTDYLACWRVAESVLPTPRRVSEGQWKASQSGWSFVEEPISFSDTENQDLTAPTRLTAMKESFKQSTSTTFSMPPRPKIVTNRDQRLLQVFDTGSQGENFSPKQLQRDMTLDQKAGKDSKSAGQDRRKIPRKQVGGSSRRSKSPTGNPAGKGSEDPSAGLSVACPAVDKVVDVQDMNNGPFRKTSQSDDVNNGLCNTFSASHQHHYEDIMKEYRNAMENASSVRSNSSPPLNQRLPVIRLQHPSQASYQPHLDREREARRLPPSLRSGTQKRRAMAESEATADFLPVTMKRQRPRLPRQEGQGLILKTFGTPEIDMPSSSSSHPKVSSNLKGSTEKPVHTGAQAAGAYRPAQQLIASTEQAHRFQNVSSHAIQEMHHTRIPLSSNRRLEIGLLQDSQAATEGRNKDLGVAQHRSALNKIPVQREVAGGERSFSNGYIDPRAEGMLQGLRARPAKTSQDQVKDFEPGKSQVEGNETKADADHTNHGAVSTLATRYPTGDRSHGTSVSLLPYNIDSSAQAPKKRQIQRLANLLVWHVRSTFARALLAIHVLGDSEARVCDYLAALKHTALAFFYLLSLLQILYALRSLVEILGVILFYIWHPLQAVLLMVRWFMRV